MSEKRPKSRTDDSSGRIEGDPGVGGMLADPEEAGSNAPALPRRPAKGKNPSADPAPPRSHRDWSPNKKPTTPAR